MNYENLTPQQQEKARACKSAEELEAFAKKVGFVLSDEQLEGISGGICKRDCSWYNGICSNDYNCLTDSGCQPYELCNPLALSQCSENTGPIPIPCPIVECPAAL